MERLLTLEEVAELLQVDLSEVQALVDASDLPSVSIGRVVRVRPNDVAACVETLARRQGLEALGRRLGDPREWARLMDPEFKAKILAEEHAPGTFGAFLKEAAEAADAKAAARNVVDLPSGSKRDPSIKD